MNKPKIMLYALSTCAWCIKTKALLKELKIKYNFIDVDLLSSSEKNKAINELKKHNPECTFPTLIINNKVIIGFDEEEIKKCLK